MKSADIIVNHSRHVLYLHTKTVTKTKFSVNSVTITKSPKTNGQYDQHSNSL
jgi:hypothetical protein